MPKVVLADIYHPEVLKRAAEHLQKRGVEARWTRSGAEVIQILDKGDIEVAAFGFELYDRDGSEVMLHLQESQMLSPKVIWIAQLGENSENEEVIKYAELNWHWPLISSYLVRPYSTPYSAWQLVLSVEQFLYRP